MHDWHSAEYVAQWISSDVTRDEERRAVLERVARLLPFAPDDPIHVLDVGAGYAMLTREVLQRFPNAHVVLHDISEPMFEHARERLGEHLDRTTFVLSDLRDPGWSEGLGPFDAVVSSIAIHNVREPPVIRRVYADIRRLLGPGGCFYNIDFVPLAGPLTARAGGRRPEFPRAGEVASLSVQLAWLLEDGFDEADCLLRVDGQTLLAGFVAGEEP